jgi:hypothetical protein
MFDGEWLSAELPPGTRERLQRAIDFWNALPIRISNEGGTRDGVLEGMRAEFEDLLSSGRPIDLNEVESLTAQAALLFQGRRSF